MLNIIFKKIFKKTFSANKMGAINLVPLWVSDFHILTDRFVNYEQKLLPFVDRKISKSVWEIVSLTLAIKISF